MPVADERFRAVSDADIIAGSRGEPSEFALIFDRHYEAIWRYLDRRIGRALADELAAETFVRAFTSRAHYDPAYDDSRPWLYGIATNMLRKHARAEERRRRAYARAAEPDRSGGGLEGAEARADAAALGPAVAAALARLQVPDRDALLLLALTDLDYQGIALATGAPVGTVRSRLHRARRHLQVDLGLDDRTPPLDPTRTERSQT
jgi:RNA polymerase sigma-70 factor (ECF subfamily)